jgi:hypothetical protein
MSALFKNKYQNIDVIENDVVDGIESIVLLSVLFKTLVCFLWYSKRRCVIDAIQSIVVLSTLFRKASCRWDSWSDCCQWPGWDSARETGGDTCKLDNSLISKSDKKICWTEIIRIKHLTNESNENKLLCSSRSFHLPETDCTDVAEVLDFGFGSLTKHLDSATFRSQSGLYNLTTSFEMYVVFWRSTMMWLLFLFQGRI